MTPAARAAEADRKSSEMAISQTPEDAIREWLADPGLRGPDGAPLPFRVLANTIGFVKSRGGSDRQIWYVMCDADGGPRGTQSWHWTVVASRGASGSWTVHGVAGGGGVGALPQRRVPWANLGGNWGHDGFRAGGTVEDAGKNVSRVRLTDAKGRPFEDPWTTVSSSSCPRSPSRCRCLSSSSMPTAMSWLATSGDSSTNSLVLTITCWLKTV